MGLEVDSARASLAAENPNIAFIQEHAHRGSLLEREGLECAGVKELELLERGEALRGLPISERRRRRSHEREGEGERRRSASEERPPKLSHELFELLEALLELSLQSCAPVGNYAQLERALAKLLRLHADIRRNMREASLALES